MNRHYKIKQLKELLKQGKPKNATLQTWEKRQEALRKEIEMLEKGIVPPNDHTPKTMKNQFWNVAENGDLRTSKGTGWSNHRMKITDWRNNYKDRNND